MNNTTKVKEHNRQSTYSLVLIALFAAVLCVSAYISIPLPNGSHITLFNFVVTLIALVFPLKSSFLIVFIWLMLGMLGVPVLIGGNSGLGYLFGQYGGFSFAFIIIAILVPLIRGKKYNRIYYTIVSVLAVTLVDIIGSLWIMAVSQCSFKAAFIIGFLPFIAIDIAKAVVAAQLVVPCRKMIYSHDTL